MKKSKKVSKKSKVLAHLYAGNTITPREALDLYGSFRLGAIIFELRDEGHRINTEIAKGSGHAIYSIDDETVPHNY